MGIPQIINKNNLLTALLLFIFLPVNYQLFWKTPAIGNLAALIVIAGCFVFFHQKIDFIRFFAGLIFGSLGEISAVSFGVWYYALPDFFGIPIWLGLYWGVGILLSGVLADSLGMKNSKTVNPWKEFIVFSGVYSAILAVLYFFPKDNLIILALFSVLFLIVFRIKNKEHLFFALFLAPAGTILEIYFTFQNVWGYTNPCFFKITYWLPLLYALFSVTLLRLISGIHFFIQNPKTAKIKSLDK